MKEKEKIYIQTSRFGWKGILNHYLSKVSSKY